MSSHSIPQRIFQGFYDFPSWIHFSTIYIFIVVWLVRSWGCGWILDDVPVTNNKSINKSLSNLEMLVRNIVPLVYVTHSSGTATGMEYAIGALTLGGWGCTVYGYPIYHSFVVLLQ